MKLKNAILLESTIVQRKFDFTTSKIQLQLHILCRTAR